MILDKLLVGAVKLWLRSQTEGIEKLQVKVFGKDQQILNGEIPQVLVTAVNTVYQGLHLGQVELTSNNISFNLPEVLKRKPLKLLAPVTVTIQLKFTERDLQASLVSSLLSTALQDLWRDLQANSGIKSFSDDSLQWQQINLQEDLLILKAISAESIIEVTLNLKLVNPQTLVFTPQNNSFDQLKPMEIHLGEDVALTQLSLGSNQLLILGEIKIFP